MNEQSMTGSSFKLEPAKHDSKLLSIRSGSRMAAFSLLLGVPAMMAGCSSSSSSETFYQGREYITSSEYDSEDVCERSDTVNGDGNCVVNPDTGKFYSTTHVVPASYSSDDDDLDIKMKKSSSSKSGFGSGGHSSGG